MLYLAYKKFKILQDHSNKEICCLRTTINNTSHHSRMTSFTNSTSRNKSEIPTFEKDNAQAAASDFANYFCSYAQLYHQKQMLADHNRMAAYHSAIIGNRAAFEGKVVMDVGSGSGILAVWAAMAGAKKVFAIEYTDMAANARKVVEHNGVSDVVTVIQGAVEEIDLSLHGVNPGEVDIIISEWMGYFLLRESMLDSLIKARDKWLKPNVGLMFPSHCTMLLAPITDEDERKACTREMSGAMEDWSQFVSSTRETYGVSMSCLTDLFEKESKEYYMLSSRWSELPNDALLAEPAVLKIFDMCTCTLEDSLGFLPGNAVPFSFEVDGNMQSTSNKFDSDGYEQQPNVQKPPVVSGFAGWFTADFKSRTDEAGVNAPKLQVSE